jgi:hypothetical protein
MILNFKVPENLYSKIDSYDLVKPKVEKAAAAPKAVNNFPKAGIPEQLIPAAVIPKNVLLTTINDLNVRCNDTYWYNTDSIAGTHGTVQYVVSKKANKYWSAIWFDTSKSEIAFGYSYCFRNLKSYKNHRYASFFKEIRLDETDFTVIKHNKKEYLYHTEQVTGEDLIGRKFTNVFPVYNTTSGIDFTGLLKTRLREYILVWNNSPNVFDAYNTSLHSLLSVRGVSDHNWVPDFNYVLSAANKELAEKINTPFFRRKFTLMCQTAIDQYNSPDFDRYKLKFNTRYSLDILSWINSLYKEEVSVDYLQQVWEGLNFDNDYLKYRYFNSHSMRVKWISDNIPMKSFINMIIRDWGVLMDSLGMLRDVVNRNPDIKYTGRWRTQEFHDWIMAEQWKQCNKNQDLPQDLFPAPVKVEGMTFIQPINTHQLAQWGRAARNCVGSSSYYNGIIKKNHFIILALNKNEPYLTIQARLEGEHLKVVQIKKTCNASLNSSEEVEYQKLFQNALMIRSAQLAEKS